MSGSKGLPCCEADMSFQFAQQLNNVKKELDELKGLKHQAALVSKLRQEISKLKQEIKITEAELTSTGSTKTLEEVEVQIDAAANDL